MATVQQYSNFDPEKDCEVLRKAMKGLGTDEAVIITITSQRNLTQRLEIITKYKQMYGRDLKQDLKSELSGDFEDLVLALYTPSAQIDAKYLHEAVKGLGTDESALIEILATRSNAQIQAIKGEYKKHYKEDLEKALGGDLSGDLKRLMIALSNGARDESNNVDNSKAQADAEALYKAGEKKLGTDEAEFIKIFGSRSHAQLRATFDYYCKISKKDIFGAIRSEFSGHLENALMAVAENAQSPSAYFAKVLYKSMKGAGTNEKQLNRVIVTRCEVDMVQIKEAFQKMYKKSLHDFIKDDVSGDYKKMLLALI